MDNDHRYYPNTRYWKIGDLVIHDVDAKRKDMLMQVIGYNRVTGLCITVYAFPSLRAEAECRGCSEQKQRSFMYKLSRQKYENELRYLHDPRRFGIEIQG